MDIVQARRFVAAWGLLFAGSALAYTPTVTQSGTPVRWGGNVKLEFAGNPLNRSGLSDAEVYTAVVHGLQRWNQASGGAVSFDYWQGTDASVYEPNSNYNGISSIYFASNSKDSASLTPNVLGLTQVWYDTKTGRIFETDIALNDKDFHFTVNEQDTSGYGSGTTPAFGSRNNVFIENVITHELGHALGLSHSGGLQSTMLFMESPEQAHLGCDEQVAVHALYPSGDAGQRGKITGSVRTASGAGVFGAQVLAISRERGTVLATALTSKNGDYAIDALEPGTYYLMVEPFFAGAAPLPSYFSEMNTTVCPAGRVFGRSLLTDSSGYRLQPVTVGASQAASAPTLIARCGVNPAASGAAISAISSLTSSLSGPEIYNGAHDSGGFGFTDKLTQETVRYPLQMLSGTVEIHALAYSLYSPIHPAIELVDSSGNTVNAQVFDHSYESASGFINYDSYLRAQDLPPGNYTLRVSSHPLDASLYPAGPVSIDSQPFLVVTGTVGDPALPLAGAIANNTRCRSSEGYSNYTSPPGLPPRHSTQLGGDAGGGGGGGIGFCGTLADARSDQNGQGPGAIAGWFLPWGLMAAMAQLARVLGSRRNRGTLA